MALTRGIVTGIACLGLLAVAAGTARAQTEANSFGAVGGKMMAGKTVFVTNESGQKVKGKLLDLSTSSLTVLVGKERRTLQASDVRELTEVQHYTKKGALGGLALGAIVGFVGVMASCADCGDEAVGFAIAGAVAWGGIGAGIGALAGAATTHERVLYRAANPQSGARVTVSPLVSKSGAGIAASLRF